MLVAAKLLLLSFSVMGIAGTGATGMVLQTPLSNAIEIHEDHLGVNTTLPLPAIKGQQMAYDHLMKNNERWIAKNHTWMPDFDDSETDDLDDD